MPGWFERYGLRTPYSSSAGHRNAERVNAGAEVIASTLEAFSPSAMIPGKFAQIFISGYSFFRSDTHTSEKIMHAVQGLISMTQVGLSIALLFNGSVCTTDNQPDICKALFLMQLLYRGTLLASWAPSEFSKDPYELQDDPQQHQANNV